MALEQGQDLFEHVVEVHQRSSTCASAASVSGSQKVMSMAGTSPWPWTTRCEPAPAGRSRHTACRGPGGSGPGAGACPAPRPGRGPHGRRFRPARPLGAGVGMESRRGAAGPTPDRPVAPVCAEVQASVSASASASSSDRRRRYASLSQTWTLNPHASPWPLLETLCSSSGRASDTRPARTYAITQDRRVGAQ